MAKKAAPKEPKLERPSGKLVPKEIPITLTDKQRLAHGQREAQLTKERIALSKQFEEEEKAWKVRRAEFKNKIKNLLDQADKLSEEIGTGKAVITDQAVLHSNHEAGVMEYHYEFPGEGWKCFETRVMEDNERQLSLVKEQVEAMPETGQEVED